MKKEYECNLCGEIPCKLTVDYSEGNHLEPEECPFHNDCDFKAKWVEKKEKK